MGTTPGWRSRLADATARRMRFSSLTEYSLRTYDGGAGIDQTRAPLAARIGATRAVESQLRSSRRSGAADGTAQRRSLHAGLATRRIDRVEVGVAIVVPAESEEAGAAQAQLDLEAGKRIAAQLVAGLPRLDDALHTHSDLGELEPQLHAIIGLALRTGRLAAMWRAAFVQLVDLENDAVAPTLQRLVRVQQLLILSPRPPLLVRRAVDVIEEPIEMSFRLALSLLCFHHLVMQRRQRVEQRLQL